MQRLGLEAVGWADASKRHVIVFGAHKGLSLSLPCLCHMR